MYNTRLSSSQFASSQKTRILNSRRKSSSSSSTSATPPNKKRSLPPPTTFPDFCMSLLLYICRQYLLYDLCTKLCIYTIVLLFGSLVHDFLPLPGVYLSRKDNILNVIFVKWSWAWTLVSLGPFIYQTATVLGAGDKRKAWKNVARLLVGTIVWFVCTNFFDYFGRRTGICSKSHHSDNYHVCSANGGKWRSFDISGHVFLLVYICLLNAEEASVFRNWYRIRQIVDENLAAAENADVQPSVSLAKLSRGQLNIIRRDFEFYVRSIEWNFVLITALNLVWDVCFVVTVFYYHTAAQKFLAFGLAVFSWFITYRLWYKCENASPGLPGQSTIKYNERPDVVTVKK